MIFHLSLFYLRPPLFYERSQDVQQWVCLYYFKFPTQHRVFIKMNSGMSTTKNIADTRLHSLAAGHMKRVSCTSACLATWGPHAY